MTETANTKENSKENEGAFQSFIKVWQESFNYKGRTGRYDFWSFCFVNSLIYICLKLVAVFEAPGLLNFVYLFDLVSTVPLVAAIVRRMHDIGRNVWGWFVVPLIICLLAVLFLPLVRVIIVFLYILILTILCCLKGKVEDNQYGVSIPEDKKQKTSVYLIIFLSVVLPLLLCGFVLTIGAISGYSRAMIKFKDSKTYEQIQFIKTNLRTLYGSTGSYEKVSNLNAINSGVVPSEMLESGKDIIKTANGGTIQLFGTEDRFTIQLLGIDTIKSCENFRIQMLLTDSKNGRVDTSDFKINEGGTDCSQCDEKPCILSWTYK